MRLGVGTSLLTALLLRATGVRVSLIIFAFGFLAIALWGGWVIAQAWLYPRRLAQAERLWCANRPSQEVLNLTSSATLARGEIAYRLRLLASVAYLKEGDRARACQESFLAHLFRLPMWKRLPIQIYFRMSHLLDPGSATTWEARLHRLAPEMAPLGHRRASRELAAEAPEFEKRAWEQLLAILPSAQDDPVILESMMVSALERIESATTSAVQLGHQEWSPSVPYLFEETFHLLLHRHGEPRIAWDRTSPAFYLLQQGRPREVVLLAQNLPPGQQSRFLCEMEVIALRQMGDLPGAQAAIHSALKEHPSSFRLWMERFHAAMATSETGIALDSLEMAERLLPDQIQGIDAPQQNEWHLRRAEFAHWVEHAPDLAWSHLQALSERVREENGLFVLQIQIALERYEAGLEGSHRLLARHPNDIEILMLQAECMAGMDAWAPLLPFLERLAEEARERSTFWHLKGLAQAHLGNPQEAREDLEIAVHMAPRDLQLVLDAGHAAMELNDHTRAEYHWRRALQLDRKCEEALLQLADTRQARQDPEGARRLLRECLLHYPDSENAQVFLAELEAN